MAVPPKCAVRSVVTVHRGSKANQGMIKQPNVQNWQCNAKRGSEFICFDSKRVVNNDAPPIKQTAECEKYRDRVNRLFEVFHLPATQ
jgi:hypothetical protein